MRKALHRNSVQPQRLRACAQAEGTHHLGIGRRAVDRGLEHGPPQADVQCVHLHRATLVVDPGDASPVTAWLKANQLQLDGILVTHHHGDHTGGVAALQKMTGAQVYGPATESLLLSPQGIVFASSKPEWIGDTDGAPDAVRLAEIRALKQFRAGPPISFHLRRVVTSPRAVVMSKKSA